MTTEYGNQYRLMKDGRYYNMDTKCAILGYVKPVVTEQNGIKITTGSRFHISRYIVNSTDEVIQLATIGHELIHAYHFSKGMACLPFSECIAYRYSVEVYRKNGYFMDSFAKKMKGIRNGYWGLLHPGYSDIASLHLPYKLF